MEKTLFTIIRSLKIFVGKSEKMSKYIFMSVNCQSHTFGVKTINDKKQQNSI